MLAVTSYDIANAFLSSREQDLMNECIIFCKVGDNTLYNLVNTNEIVFVMYGKVHCFTCDTLNKQLAVSIFKSCLEHRGDIIISPLDKHTRNVYTTVTVNNKGQYFVVADNYKEVFLTCDEICMARSRNVLLKTIHDKACGNVSNMVLNIPSTITWNNDNYKLYVDVITKDRCRVIVSLYNTNIPGFIDRVLDIKINSIDQVYNCIFTGKTCKYILFGDRE